MSCPKSSEIHIVQFLFIAIKSKYMATATLSFAISSVISDHFAHALSSTLHHRCLWIIFSSRSNDCSAQSAHTALIIIVNRSLFVSVCDWAASLDRMWYSQANCFDLKCVNTFKYLLFTSCSFLFSVERCVCVCVWYFGFLSFLY